MNHVIAGVETIVHNIRSAIAAAHGNCRVYKVSQPRGTNLQRNSRFFYTLDFIFAGGHFEADLGSKAGTWRLAKVLPLLQI